MGTAAIALAIAIGGTVVLVALVVFLAHLGEQADRALALWLQGQGYRLLCQSFVTREAFLARNPLSRATPGAQRLRQITVLDPDGRLRRGWVRTSATAPPEIHWSTERPEAPPESPPDPPDLAPRFRLAPPSGGPVVSRLQRPVVLLQALRRTMWR
jgi:hypothetical protein